MVDENIPKLPYMTIMDYFVFISFIFCAIPNLLAIYSYQYFKKFNKNNFILNYSFPIMTFLYITSFLIILILHANIYQDNTTDFLGAFNFNK